MKRREFIGLGLLALVMWPERMSAQAAVPSYRVGYLGNFLPLPSTAAIMQGFRDGLRDLGYVEGGNLTLEVRYSQGHDEHWPDLIRELIAAHVQVVATGDTAAALAMKQQTRTTPLVLLGVIDPIGSGLIESLARPGGTVTGLSNQLGDVESKILQLARQLVPRLSRVAIYWNPTNVGSAASLKSMQDLFASQRITAVPVTGRTQAELDESFSVLRASRPDAILVHAWYTGLPGRARIIDFAVRNRIPTLTASAPLARDGLLLSYAPDIAAIFRRGAYFVDRILKGVKPADLPVEQPTKFDLIINAKTARAMGLAVPQALLLQADQVIE